MGWQGPGWRGIGGRLGRTGRRGPSHPSPCVARPCCPAENNVYICENPCSHVHISPPHGSQPMPCQPAPCQPSRYIFLYFIYIYICHIYYASYVIKMLHIHVIKKCTYIIYIRPSVEDLVYGPYPAGMGRSSVGWTGMDGAALAYIIFVIYRI